MNKVERIKMVKAMEFIARKINDESIFDLWMTLGVADGDIKHGDLSSEDPGEDLDYYLDDDTFSEIMRIFLATMKHSYKSGGLYCDNVVSKEKLE